MCIKCMEPLSFDSPAENDVVRRFPTSAKVICQSHPGLEPETSRTETECSSHSATEAPEFSKKVVTGRRTEVAIRSLVNARGFQIESCMKHCLCLFLCMVVRQCYGRRRRDLE